MALYLELCSIIAESKWEYLNHILNLKDFRRNEQGKLVDRNVLAKLAETLTSPELDISDTVKTRILQCFVNSCDGYVHEGFPEDLNDDDKLRDCCHKLYASLISSDNPPITTFPYDGILQWTVNYIITNVDHAEEYGDRPVLLNLSIKFICNFIVIARHNGKVPAPLNNNDFKTAIATLTRSKHVRICESANAYVHNALNAWSESYFELQMQSLAKNLIFMDSLPLCEAAKESLTFLLQRPRWLRSIYEDLSTDSRLHLLRRIIEKVDEFIESPRDAEAGTLVPSDLVEFLAQRFKKKSDLVLKTVDSYLKDLEPAEIPLMLDIIGKISSMESQEYHFLQNDKSLMINCIYMLKSVQMVGKASDNYFTPLQKLDANVPWHRDASGLAREIQKHPAFGFKAGLVRAIGNLAHQHKGNQKLLNETDAIPLLLDCCNIDAKNPLIIQWAILALRNACYECPENQEIIRNCNRVGIINDELIKSMGVKLQERKDGKTIGIVPLPRNGPKYEP